MTYTYVHVLQINCYMLPYSKQSQLKVEFKTCSSAVDLCDLHIHDDVLVMLINSSTRRSNVPRY